MSRLDEVVELAEKKIPRINKKIETMTPQLLDAFFADGSKAFSEHTLVEDIWFEIISPTISLQGRVIGVHDDLAIHLPQTVQPHLIKVLVYIILNK